MYDIVIIGAGGHGRVVADAVIKSGDRILGFLDDTVPQDQSVLGYPVLGKICDAVNFKEPVRFVLGIGSNTVRREIVQRYPLCFHTVVHPSAVLAFDVMLGEGSVVLAGCIVNTGASVGSHCILNSGCIVEHDCVVSDFTHISPNATLCGTVHVGTLCHIGAGSVIRNNIHICDGCTIGIGAAVVKDITQGGIYAGVPARRLPENGK